MLPGFVWYSFSKRNKKRCQKGNALLIREYRLATTLVGVIPKTLFIISLINNNYRRNNKRRKENLCIIRDKL